MADKATSKNIVVIHSSDADQHLGRLQRILSRMQEEKRIELFTVFDYESLAPAFIQALNPQDLAILVMTQGLGPHIMELNTRLAQTKSLTVIGILIDDIKPVPTLSLWPENQKPIRREVDMDGVWTGIESHLLEMFPKPVEPTEPSFWKKYRVYILIGLGLIIIFLIGPPKSCTDKSKPEKATEVKAEPSSHSNPKK